MNLHPLTRVLSYYTTSLINFLHLLRSIASVTRMHGCLCKLLQQQLKAVYDLIGSDVNHGSGDFDECKSFPFLFTARRNALQALY